MELLGRNRAGDRPASGRIPVLNGHEFARSILLYMTRKRHQLFAPAARPRLSSVHSRTTSSTMELYTELHCALTQDRALVTTSIKIPKYQYVAV
jgi:hypothetical protein